MQQISNPCVAFFAALSSLFRFAPYLCVPFLFAAPTRAAEPCAPASLNGADYTVCTFDPATTDVRLFWKDANGQAFGGFSSLADGLAAQGLKLVFAMNAGMYQPDLSPVGLYVENGKLLHPVNNRAGKGNFNLKPNGIFWIGDKSAGVMETARYMQQQPKAFFATQSGPMLVIGGTIHPKIHEDGTSEKLRNGVGKCSDGKIRFAISEVPVTFHAFAKLFRDQLQCPDALFLDGSISALYAPALNRHDGWKAIGPIVGVVEKAK